MTPWCVSIQMKAIERYYHLELFIMANFQFASQFHMQEMRVIWHSVMPRQLFCFTARSRNSKIPLRLTVHSLCPRAPEAVFLSVLIEHARVSLQEKVRRPVQPGPLSLVFLRQTAQVVSVKENHD